MNTADRLLRTDDVLFHPAVPLPTAVASFSFITAAALGRGADNPFGALAQFKLLLGDGANTTDERLAPNDIFQDVLVSIVNTASASLGHAPMTIPRAQAADVVAFLPARARSCRSTSSPAPRTSSSPRLRGAG